jgi:hypothetical protein
MVLTWIAIFRGNSTVMKCGWGPSELKGKGRSSGFEEEREMCAVWNGIGKTHCQNVSGSWSCKHSGPKPNLNEETDHLARWPMSGHGSTGGLLTASTIDKMERLLDVFIFVFIGLVEIENWARKTYDCERGRRLRGSRQGRLGVENRIVRLSSYYHAVCGTPSDR